MPPSPILDDLNNALDAVILRGDHETAFAAQVMLDLFRVTLSEFLKPSLDHPGADDAPDVPPSRQW